MKQKINKLTCLVAAVLLAGCSGSELPEGLQPGGPSEADIPLNVTVASLEAEVESAPGTRATSNLTTGSIGIFRDNSNGYTAVNNIRYNYGSTKWTPQTASETIYLGLQSVNVCAYHPWSSGKTTAIALTSGVYAAANDLSYATNLSVDGRTNKTTALTFAMKRAYARIGFTLKRDNYPGTCAVTKVTLKNIVNTASLNITGTPAYNGGTGSKGTVAIDAAPSSPVTVTATVGGTTAWPDSYLLPPCTPYTDGMEITLTVDGRTMTTTVPKTSYTPVAGQWKTITLTLKGTDLKASSVTTENWTNQDISGEYTPLP